MSLPASSSFRRFTEKTLDLLLPPLCLSCDAPVAENRALCPHCWGSIHWLASPLCYSCGAPFEVPVGEGMQCADCLNHPPVFAMARAAMVYNDASKRLVLGFKHSDRIHPAVALASWMQQRAGEEFWRDVDIIMPVPLHRWRLFKRRYNQSALLAQELARLTGKPVLVNAMLRLRVTPPQGHMNREERRANVKAAFSLNPRFTAQIRNKTVVLVDDVLTTGATANECSQKLLDNDAKCVKVLTLARVKGFA